MAYVSSSSSRTLLDRRPGKQKLPEDDAESSINLNNLEIPNLDSCNSFDFMNENLLEDEECIRPVSPPLSPQTIEDRAAVLRESLELGRAEFPVGCHLDYISYYANRAVDWVKIGAWVDFKSGYRRRVPGVNDRVWMMPEYGMQGIPLILFEYGLRLPLHPFHLAVYEAIGCGITQLVPNSVAQVIGFIALCHERDRVPSIRLFFSIYGVRYHKGQVFFDTRSKRPKIVSVRSSNSGYHPKWLYFYGRDLEFVRPCRKISEETIRYLNTLEKYDKDYLDAFQGSRSVFTHLELKESKFLEDHHRKILEFI